MRDLKYVMNKELGKFILIPDIGIAHSEIDGNWTSAGFVSFSTRDTDDCGNVLVKPTCYGKSVSLGLKCEEGDTEYMERSLMDRIY